MIKDLLAMPAAQQTYELTFLARDLYRNNRFAEARLAYEAAAKENSDILSPADWIRWADSDRANRGKILLQATKRFPDVPTLHFGLGLTMEGVSPMAAIDAYFIEQYGVVDTVFDKDAAARMMVVISQGAAGSPAQSFGAAFATYLAAQNLNADPSAKAEAIAAYRDARDGFAAVAKRGPTFAGRVYEAENSMYYSLLGKSDTSDAKQLLKDLIKDEPTFAPAYMHLFSIAYCEGNKDEGKRWVLSGIEHNPYHRMLRAPLAVVDGRMEFEPCN